MAALLLVCCGMVALAPVASLASALDDKIAAFGAATTQTAGAVGDVLKTGLAENRSAEAYAAMKPWLTANPSDSQALLFYAGRTAEYAGEWTDAASFYRKLLKQKNVNAKLAADVVPAMYRLLINNLQDPNAAYLFMREEGNRLRQYGRASQFDGWFCQKALQRGDLAALAARLALIYGSATAVPTVQDTEWLDALLAAVETVDHHGEALLAALKRLAAAPKTTPLTRARLDWAMAIAPILPRINEYFKDDNPDALLKAARALLAADPVVGGPLVVKGWTRLNRTDTPSFFRFVYAHRERKAEPFVQVLQTQSPEQAKALLATGAKGPRGRWVALASFLSPAQTGALVQRFPALFNAIDAPSVDLWDKEMTVAQAKTLAPHLARNPQPDAALVRAYAVAGTNTVSAMVPVMMKSERWRFDNAKSVVDTVWNSGADRAGANHGELVKQYEKQGARHDQLSKQISKEADSKSRLTAFVAIYKELRGNPATPGLLSLWHTLFTQAPPADLEKMLQKLVSDFVSAPPAARDLQKYLLGQAIQKSSFGNAYSSLTFGPNFRGGWDRWGYQNVRKALPGLAAHLGTLLRQQMVAGTLSEPVFGMWLHCVDPGKPDAKALFEELVKSKAYAKMDAAYHQMAAHKLLFGEAALIEESPTDPRVVSRELLALPADAAPVAVETALKTVMMRVSQAPAPVTVLGLHKVAALPSLSGPSRGLVLTLFNQFSPLGAYPGGQGYEQLVIRLVKDMQEDGQWGTIEPYLSDFWRSAGSPDDRRYYRAAEALAGFAEAALATNQPSVALSVARSGLASRIAALDPNNRTDNAAQRRSRMRAVAGKAGQALGVAEIPVDATHPDFGIYKSNAEYVQGNLDTAWELYKQNAARLQPDPADPDAQSLLRKLPVGYAFWLLERSMAAGRTDEAENLVKELTIWSRQSEGTFSLEQEGELKIAYADLAFLKGALPTSRAWYRRVADAREYQGSSLYVTAALGSVKIDRISRNFGSALEELDKLMRVRDDDARARVHFARAEVMMAQENYREALDEVEAVLRQAPNHADALILRGQIQYKMRKLVEATEIELGVSQENKVIVPGETLKINLLDPTLSVSGVSADIEVEVVTQSGDRERLMLHQLGDSKDKFRAEVPTVLGPPVPGDKVLQVLGVDEIRYGYSKRFRAKMKDLPPDPDVVITVASDAHLSISAGAFPPREGERRLDIAELGLSSAQQALGMRAVRPGNPVYLRVIDPDQSRTAGIDEIVVSLRTSSGDEIRRLPLKETGPYSGEFEAVVPTASAQAMAFASENAPGRDPNLAISPTETPGWQGQLGEKGKRRTFGVDLNDNVPLDRMQLRWGDPESALTHFVLQTSMNGRDWVTRSRYPADTAPWDGRPRVSSFPTYGRNAIGISDPESRALPADWQEKMELTSIRASIDYKAQVVKNLSAMQPELASGGHPGYSVLMQYRAVFFQPAAAIRRFRLTGYPAEGTIFLLDGQPADDTSDDPLFIERELRPGLHEIQIWRQEGRDALAKREPVLLCDVPGQAELQACPDDMFDPATFPEGVRSQIAKPATVTLSEDKAGVDIAFGTNTQARLVRLVIEGFSGVAPVVKSVALTDRDGKVRLPVAQDAMKLRQNMQLEVLPGDQITARYEDPVTATPGRDRHEQRLKVAFNDARISVSFVEFEMLPTGERQLKLEPIRRFRHGDAVLIVIDDADMDASPKRDQIEFKITTSDGVSVTQRAVETELHSGQFVGRIFPVEGKPARASEIRITEGATLTASYRDTENLDPGIPTDRSVTIQHAQYVPPTLGLYALESEAIPVEAPTGGAGQAKQGRRGGRPSAVEVVTPRQAVDYRYTGDATASGNALEGIIGCSVRFDVVVPHLALAQSSTISAYVQVSSNGMASAAKPFDITAPGTLKLQASPQRAGAAVAPGYSLRLRPVPPTNQPPLDEGRFAFSVPLVLGPQPLRSFATRDAEALPSSLLPDGLAVKAGDVVRIGYAWQDPDGKVQWRTDSVKVVSHAFLDVMNDNYSEPLTAAYVGEKVFVRLRAYGLDRGDERDRAAVELRAARSGAAATFALRETEPHSGVFKGVFALSYADAAVPSNLPPVELNGFPVRYGDQVTVSYADQALEVSVNMGADGTVEPFSKRFTGDEMAVQTSFTLAECFFELAKKHRKMDQESLARREMGHAQKLLSEAIATHTDNELRAHAEYLLGNLAQEYADLSKNDAAKLPMYQEALARFSKIPVDYPETEFASKSQFKTALVYEKMGELEIAVEEYVKLAYKYPDSEHIPEVMSRLGGYFQKKGQAYKAQADALRDKTDLQSQSEVIRLDELSYPEFLRAARIFKQLQDRFPDDSLAGLAGLRAGQNYMRAHQYDEAISGFERVIAIEEYDGREIRSQAMYWSGLCHERRAALMSTDNWKGRGQASREAYQTYRRVTFDFPDSKWAKFARGRLADPAFGNIIAKEKAERSRMLEGLKEQRKQRR